MSMQTADDFYGEIISSYTRQQAIDDGELVDISGMALEAGFKIPVAVTRTVWDKYIEWTEKDSWKQTTQDQTGRMWDVLWMLHCACSRNRDADLVIFSLYVVPRDEVSLKPVKTSLKGVIGGGDAGEPVITIMLPNED